MAQPPPLAAVNARSEPTEPDQPVPPTRTSEHESEDEVSRYGLPESACDSFGLRDLYSRVRRDFGVEENQPVQRDESTGSLVFKGDTRKNRRHQRIEDSDSDECLTPTQQELTTAAGLPPRWREEEVSARQYIDDLSGAEKLAINTGIRTISQNKEHIAIHAGKSQAMYEVVERNASAVGMRMNGQKTQMVCVTAAINAEVRSFIYIDGKRIDSGDELKLLGYNFGRRPRPDIHIREIRRKFGARSWILRILKHASIPEASLTQVYCSLVRPILEYPSNVFHSALTEELSESLE